MITHYSNKNQLTKVLRIIFEKWSRKFHKISKIHTLDLKFRSFSHQKNVCFDFRWTIEFLLIFTAILEARYWFIRLVSNQTNKKALVLKGGESRTNHPVFYSTQFYKQISNRIDGVWISYSIQATKKNENFNILQKTEISFDVKALSDFVFSPNSEQFLESAIRTRSTNHFPFSNRKQNKILIISQMWSTLKSIKILRFY